ncbi:AAA family ATPase [Bacillus timonensis]|uniref:AAA family ATPase n=1 Tax=Bacillus timonensis TaxID=1033734 RepID=UPI0002881B50|nr:AAA family ATPase [Bacillus timonensis]
MNQFRGIILEGYSNAGKTSVLKSLKKLQANDDYAERSVVILSEHYSQVVHRANGELRTLQHKEHLQLLKDRVLMLKKLSDWARELGQLERSKGIFFILERFHLNHRVAFTDSLMGEIEQIETEMFAMGARCALLTISPENAEKRLKSRDTDTWAEKTAEEIKVACELLINTQQELRRQANASIIPTIEINTDKKDWDSYAKQILLIHE